jgi:hypothetical protein
VCASLLTTLPFARCCHHHRDDIDPSRLIVGFLGDSIADPSPPTRIQGLPRSSEEFPSVILREVFFQILDDNRPDLQPTTTVPTTTRATPTSSSFRTPPLARFYNASDLPSAKPPVHLSLASPLSSSLASHRLDTRHVAVRLYTSPSVVPTVSRFVIRLSLDRG